MGCTSSSEQVPVSEREAPVEVDAADIVIKDAKPEVCLICVLFLVWYRYV